MDRLSELAHRIGEASLCPESWPSVLSDVAEIGGGWSAQLFALANGRFIVDIAGGYSSDLSDELNRRGGGDPAISPRPGVLMRADPMTLTCDGDYLTQREKDRYPIYREFYEKVDGAYCTTAKLEARDDLFIGFAVNHSKTQGAPDALARHNLAALLPALKYALEMQVRIEDRASAMAVGAFDALSTAAFVLDFSGRIRRMSSAGEQLLAQRQFLFQRDGRLHATWPDSERELQTAIDHAARGRRVGAPCATPIILYGDDGRFRIADITTAPEQTTSLRLGACALVLVRGERARSDRLLRQLGLTRAEAEVARALADGWSPREIAASRGVSVDTVRTQMKVVYAKLDVSRQTELVSKLRDLL